MRSQHRQSGFTIVELLTAVALAALIFAAISGLVNNIFSASDTVGERNQLLQQARFAMDRIVRATSHSPKLLLPFSDNPGTNWPENIREQTIPASPPIGSSTFASAVLAVTLPAYVDLDADGFPDADDDRDGRIDEDLPNDVHHDFMPGIIGIDDDGDGSIDENPSWYWDDDESGGYNEDPINGIDDDGDGKIDEDPASDNNNDGCPGYCDVDDNNDGTIDNGSDDNDDEEGSEFEDGYDPVVFYLDGDTLVERMPVPWNTDGNSSPDGPVDGRDFVTASIADNVTLLRFERVDTSSASSPLVRIDLELTGPGGETVSLSAQTRVGGAL